LVEAPLSEPFRAPYRSEQYAKIISEAVDLQSLLAYTSQTPFVVEEFRRRLRLLWRNAKTFNPVGDPIHNAACILETFTETEMDRILADSANKTPRDVSRFCTVCWPFLARLREDDVGALFESYECSMLAEEWTDFVWKVPRPIFLKTIAESFEGYVHGDDLFADGESRLSPPSLSLCLTHRPPAPQSVASFRTSSSIAVPTTPSARKRGTCWSSRAACGQTLRPTSPRRRS
jgi:hypothetical protein